MLGREIKKLLDGKENWEIELNIRYNGRTIGSSDNITLDEIPEYKRGFLTIDCQTINSSVVKDFIEENKK